MNAVTRRIGLMREAKRLNRQSIELHAKFVEVMKNTKGCDIRAANIALIMTAVLSLQAIDDAKLRVSLQERFLKTYVKASDAPFTFYKLGQ